MHTLSGYLPYYIVNEYPKSGGSWVGEMLSDVLKVPFPRNRLPMFRSSIIHCHSMQSWNMENILIVWRDGRDVLVSQYFYSLFENDNKLNAALVERCRSDLGFNDYGDIESNLTVFMKYVFERNRYPRMSWTEFVSQWVDCEKCVHARYEDFRTQPVEVLMRIVSQLADKQLTAKEAELIVQNHSFERLAGRKAGAENRGSFMRKGIVGDWKNYFSRDARKCFHEYAGDALIKLGYERDTVWVNDSLTVNQTNHKAM